MTMRATVSVFGRFNILKKQFSKECFYGEKLRENAQGILKGASLKSILIPRLL